LAQADVVQVRECGATPKAISGRTAVKVRRRETSKMQSLARVKEHWVDVVEPIPTTPGALDVSCLSNWADARRVPTSQDAQGHNSLYQEKGNNDNASCILQTNGGIAPCMSRYPIYGENDNTESWSLFSNGAHAIAADDLIATTDASEKDVAYWEASTLAFEVAKGALVEDKDGAEIDRLTKRLREEEAKTQEARQKVERLQAVLRETSKFVEIEPEKLRDTVRHVLVIGWDNITWARGYTALHFAAEQGRSETFSLLIALSADPLAKDYKGRSAIDVARAKGHDDCVAVLQEALKDCPTTTSPLAQQVEKQRTRGGGLSDDR